jgi:hypothetical protein
MRTLEVESVLLYQPYLDNELFTIDIFAALAIGFTALFLLYRSRIQMKPLWNVSKIPSLNG